MSKLVQQGGAKKGKKWSKKSQKGGMHCEPVNGVPYVIDMNNTQGIANACMPKGCQDNTAPTGTDCSKRTNAIVTNQ